MFQILSFLIVAAIVDCVPQGYNYQHQQQHGISVHSGLQIPTPNFGSIQITNMHSDNMRIPASSNIASTVFQESIPQISNALNGPQQQLDVHSHHNIEPVVTKDIYIHAAPEEPEEQYLQAPPSNQPFRKHYRIVFIKAPTQNSKEHSIRFSQAPIEEKTIIYVLSKKDEPIDIQSALQEIQPTQPSKPEVYFIKYKTQEEAVHAQRQIQAQYDTLGGSTQISDEGIAPVTSVIGSLNRQQQSNNIFQTANNVQSSYLPPPNKK